MIHRTDKTQNNFTQIDNNLINDNSISCGAKGVLFYLLSKENSWQFYELDITNHFNDTLASIRKHIKELTNAKYITRIKTKDVKGKFIYIYNIYENPCLSNEYKIMPYKEYLQTDHWKQTRKKALKKAKYKCELCGSKENLNAHHKTYERKGNELPEDLIVLCEICHSTHHNKLN